MKPFRYTAQVAKADVQLNTSTSDLNSHTSDLNFYRASAVAASPVLATIGMSVCLSVCLSVTR